MAKSAPVFPKETDLCAAFIDAVKKDVWTPYAETGGWDILLVRNSDGFQIGIEAKLRMNVKVVNQALEEYGAWSATREGPDCRAILVPAAASLGSICDYIGITVITVTERKGYRTKHDSTFRIDPPLPDHREGYFERNWHEWSPQKRHKLPAYVPDVPAGASAPIRLTDWKIAAIKITLVLRERGYLLRSDFKHFDIDHRRWMTKEGGCLQPEHGTGRMIAAPGMNPTYPEQHPKVTAEIAAAKKTWWPPELDLQLHQARLKV